MNQRNTLQRRHDAVEGFIFGWVLGSFMIMVLKSMKRFWYLWLAAFLIYRRLTGAN
jgi:hypothetical protein